MPAFSGGRHVEHSANRSFFFSSRRRHTRFDCDWSSDVCSSDLPDGLYGLARADLDRLLAGAPVTAAGEVTAPVRLRVIGTAFFDGEHRGGPDRRDQTDGSHGHCNLSARALWEIHPVYWVRPP